MYYKKCQTSSDRHSLLPKTIQIKSKWRKCNLLNLNLFKWVISEHGNGSKNDNSSWSSNPGSSWLLATIGGLGICGLGLVAIISVHFLHGWSEVELRIEVNQHRAAGFSVEVHEMVISTSILQVLHVVGAWWVSASGVFAVKFLHGHGVF